MTRYRALSDMHILSLSASSHALNATSVQQSQVGIGVEKEEQLHFSGSLSGPVSMTTFHISLGR